MAVLSINTGPLSGIVVSIGHMDTEGWESRVQVGKNTKVSLKENWTTL